MKIYNSFQIIPKVNTEIKAEILKIDSRNELQYKGSQSSLLSAVSRKSNYNQEVRDLFMRREMAHEAKFIYQPASRKNKRKRQNSTFLGTYVLPGQIQLPSIQSTKSPQSGHRDLSRRSMPHWRKPEFSPSSIAIENNNKSQIFSIKQKAAPRVTTSRGDFQTAFGRPSVFMVTKKEKS